MILHKMLLRGKSIRTTKNFLQIFLDMFWQLKHELFDGHCDFCKFETEDRVGGFHGKFEETFSSLYVKLKWENSGEILDGS